MIIFIHNMKLSLMTIPTVEMTSEEYHTIKKGDVIEGKKIVQFINDNQELLLEGETCYRLVIVSRHSSEIQHVRD